MREEPVESNNTAVRDCELFAARLRKSLRIDLRYSVFQVSFSKSHLNIFTDSVNNAVRISQFYRKIFHDVRRLKNPGIRIKVVLLPDRTVGKLSKGICHVGVAPVRSSPESSSEQVTQVLYGETFDTLQNARGWTRTRLHADGYIGWVSFDQVTLFTEKNFDSYQSLSGVFVLERALPIFGRASLQSHPIREAVFGCEIKVVGDDGAFLKVRLPDGATGYVERNRVSFSFPVKEFSFRTLLGITRSFQGVSYMWGGRSTKAFDCSGFVQTVFRLCGVELPRDTRDQFSTGKFIGKNFGKMRTGDLLFFSSKGDKINHVAIFLGRNKEFVHSSGFVKISSLDPRRKNFSERLSTEFLGACRVVS